MERKQSTPEKDAQMRNVDLGQRKESKWRSGLKKVGFNIWLAVMIIGGALAFITALFLI